MTTYRDELLSTDAAGDESARISEAVHVRVLELEADPSSVKNAMCHYDAEEYDELEGLEALAHISDEWSSYIAAKKRIQAKWMLHLAREEIETELFLTQCARPAIGFAYQLSRDEE